MVAKSCSVAIVIAGLVSPALWAAGQDSPSEGLAWVFFDDTAMQWPRTQGVDPQIDSDTGTDIHDYARVWLGLIEAPVAGEVAFVADADDGCRLWIGGDLVIDAPESNGPREGRYRFPDAGAAVPFRLELYQRTGSAHMRLHWGWKGHSMELVPAGAFSHTEADLKQAEELLKMSDRAEGVPLSRDAARLYAPGTAIYSRDDIRLKPGPHLLIDDYLVESSDNVRRVVNTPERRDDIPNPIVTGKEDGCFQPYMTVVQDPATKRYRIWYGRPAGGVGASHLGYLESKDGIHWERPARELDDPDPITFGVSVIDEGPEFSNPPQRFKLGWWFNGGLHVAASPDGLVWTSMAPGLVIRHNHDINGIFYDPLRAEYVATVSVYRPGDDWEGKRRITMQSSSTDLLTWETPHYVVVPDSRVDEGETQFYAMDGYLVRGDLVIGMVKVLRDDLKADNPPDPPNAYGVGYTALAWTRDGEVWVRDPEHFFDPHPERGTWDHAHAWIDEQVIVGDDVYLYYAGYARGHKVNRTEERQIGLVTMKRDRYVAREAGAEPGRMVTPPVTVDADSLSLNADAAGGRIRVQVLGEDGQPLPGFTLEDCAPVEADGLAVPVTWGRPLGALKGSRVRFEFVLQNARLFAFNLE
ncbi:MAG: hypothetical protein JXR94_07630 [Candidatus Hydrogenedentes bacterium]|nr:hypothetical protein [Candidatus Hydrogenedentota bacterium]